VCQAKYYTIPPAIYSCAKTVKFQKKNITQPLPRKREKTTDQKH
jgi:hypothetical protein